MWLATRHSCNEGLMPATTEMWTCPWMECLKPSDKQKPKSLYLKTSNRTQNSRLISWSSSYQNFKKKRQPFLDWRLYSLSSSYQHLKKKSPIPDLMLNSWWSLYQHFKNDQHFVTERELQYSILRLLEAELALEKARQETAVKPPSSKKTQGKHYIIAANAVPLN